LAPNSPSFETPTPVTWLDTLDRLLSSVKIWRRTRVLKPLPHDSQA
jgi:hypothetical protein